MLYVRVGFLTAIPQRTQVRYTRLDVTRTGNGNGHATTPAAFFQAFKVRPWGIPYPYAIRVRLSELLYLGFLELSTIEVPTEILNHFWRFCF